MIKKNIITSLVLAALFAAVSVEQANARRWFTKKRIAVATHRLEMSTIEFLKSRKNKIKIAIEDLNKALAEITTKKDKIKTETNIKALKKVLAEITAKIEEEEKKLQKKANELNISVEKVIKKEQAEAAQKPAGASAPAHRKGR